MIVKKTWYKYYGFDRKLYIGYFLFGIIPLYISIQPVQYIITK